MPRKPRIHYPGAVYHVILRGNAGDPIFFTDRDRFRLYLVLQYAADKFDCRIHGFCLMSNHVHLILQVADVPLSRIMQNVSLRYTQWINLTRKRTGHVFQGRYKALLLDADAYLLELVRYVHLNPVRAGAASRPEDYPWSGHRAYLGAENLPWLTTEWVLSMLAPTEARARKVYRRFIADGAGKTRQGEYHAGTCEGRILGDDTFAERVLHQADQQRPHRYSLQEVLAAVCQAYGITEVQLAAPGKTRFHTEPRAIAALLVQRSPHLRLTDLGKELERDISALGKAAERVGKECARDAVLAARVEGLWRTLGECPKV